MIQFKFYKVKLINDLYFKSIWHIYMNVLLKTDNF